MRVLTMAASLRSGSLNKKLINQVIKLLQRIPEIELDNADFREFEMPIYDGDNEQASGVPAGGKEFARRLSQVDAIIISTPEYNGGIPGALKNALDWASRITPSPFSGKPLLLIGASPGSLGAIRGLWHTRVPFEVVGALVHPEMFGLPHANQAFNENGELTDPKNLQRLEKLINTFVKHSLAITNSNN